METNENLLSTDLQVDSIAEIHLRETAKWARFLGVTGFIFAILLALLAFAMPSFISTAMRQNPYNSSSASIFSAMSGMITILYLIIAGIMFMVSYFVHKFGVAIRNGLAQNDQAGLNEGFLNLKRLFRFYGIIVIIYLGFLALALIGVVVAAL